MTQSGFLETQAVELVWLLEQASDDPVLAPQLRERLHDVQEKLQASKAEEGTLLPKVAPVLPRAALFLQGGGVEDSNGIRPSLAGEALIQYERMFMEQALHDEREAARIAGRQRRPKGAPRPTLLFTGTPRGSFGLEFVPKFADDVSALEVHRKSLENISDALARIAAGEDSFEAAVREVPAQVLPPLKQFLKTLASHGAELRLSFPDQPSRRLAADQIKRTAERLEREITQETAPVEGTFRGVTLESGVFDLRLPSGEVITGTIADELTEEDIEQISGLTNHLCKAELQKTTIRKVTGESSTTYVLLQATAAAGS